MVRNSTAAAWGVTERKVRVVHNIFACIFEIFMASPLFKRKAKIKTNCRNLLERVHSVYWKIPMRIHPCLVWLPLFFTIHIRLLQNVLKRRSIIFDYSRFVFNIVIKDSLGTVGWPIIFVIFKLKITFTEIMYLRRTPFPMFKKIRSLLGEASDDELVETTNTTVEVLEVWRRRHWSCLRRLIKGEDYPMPLGGICTSLWC